MDPKRVDQLARVFARDVSRRAAVHRIGASIATVAVAAGLPAGRALAQDPVASPQTRNEDCDALKHRDQRLADLEAAFDESRRADVPTYAPTLFAEAQRLFNDIRDNWFQRRASQEVDEQLSGATDALERATTIAQGAAPHLSSLVQARSQVIHDGLVGSRAAEELYEAERQFHEAIRRAESQDLPAAQRLAATAERRYFEATLTALEKGPIQRLVHDIEYAREVSSPSVHRLAQAEVEDLGQAVQAAGSGEISLATLRAKIVASSRFTRRLLDQGASDPIGGEIDPPLAPPDDWAPGTFEAPDAPVTMRISERTADSLTVTWRNLGGVVDSIVLERSTSDGPWVAVSETGPVSEWQSFEDTGLAPDTPHRYRVRSQNAYGASFTVPGNQAVGFTRTEEDFPVWRVQLVIRVVDLSDAGSDDSLRVRLNSPLPTYSPSSNDTWMDHAPRPTNQSPSSLIDDFGRGSEWIYDLNLDTIHQLSDITMISLTKEGTDAVGIAGFTLKVNGAEVFIKSFGETPARCLWLDEDDGHAPTFTVYHPELRTHPNWQSYMRSPASFPQTIGNEELRERFEGIAGDALHGKKAYWRGGASPVRVTRQDDQTLRVRLALKADVNYLPNPDVDLTFDIRVTISCNDAATEATLSLVTTNVAANADFNVLVDLLGLATAPAGVALVLFAEQLVNRSFLAAWTPIVRDLVINPPVPGFCPGVSIDEDANGEIFVNFRPF